MWTQYIELLLFSSYPQFLIMTQSLQVAMASTKLHRQIYITSEKDSVSRCTMLAVSSDPSLTTRSIKYFFCTNVVDDSTEKFTSKRCSSRKTDLTSDNDFRQGIINFFRFTRLVSMKCVHQCFQKSDSSFHLHSARELCLWYASLEQVYICLDWFWTECYSYLP